MADLGDLVARILLDSKEFNVAMKDVETQASDTADKASGSMGGLGGAMDLLTGAAVALGAVFAFDKLVDFGASALEAAANTEHLEAAFRAINGPTAETNKLLEDLAGMEFASLFDFEDTLGPAAKNMLDLGVSADQTGKTMSALVDAASGLKKGPEWITAVSGTIATMQTHIVASAKDMKALEAQGVSAWGALAAKIGTDVPTAMEKVKAGLVSAETVTQAVTEQMGERFKGAGEASLHGWQGAMHLLDQATENVMVALGKTIGEMIIAIKPLLDIAIKAILEFAKAWESTQGPVQWIMENWPAIKAVWEELSRYLGVVFEPVVKQWESDWNNIKVIFSTVFDWISKAVGVFTTGIGELFKWVGIVVSKIPGVSDEMKKLGTIWDDQTAKIKLNKEATEERKKAQEASLAVDAKARQEAKLKEAQDVASANAAKKFAEERKKADTELLALSKQWVAADKAFQDSQKKNEDAFAKAYAKMRNEVVDTVEIIVSNFDRLGGPGNPVAEFVKRADEARFSLEKLGVTSSQELTQAATDAANWAGKVEIAFKSGQTSAANYSAAVEASEAKQKALVDHTNRDLINAYKNLGVTSEATLRQAAVDAEAAYARIKASGTATAVDLYIAWQSVQTAQQAVADHANKELTDAYKTLGVTTVAEMRTMADEAEAAYQKIARDAGDNSVTANQTWVTKTQEAYAAILLEGGTLTQGQKSELDRARTQLENHLADTGSMWKTAYEGVRGAITGAFDALIEKLVTGEGSFKDIVTNMWQDIASAALHSFIDPVRDAVAKFIAGTIADLIGGKGFGGVIDSLTKIGETASDVFSGVGKSAGGIVGGAADAAGGVAGGAGSGAGGIAGAITSTATQAIVGMVTGVVSAITGVIGVFQAAKQETTLNAIEHNTRYSMMYLGERADGGILGVLFKTFEELAYGTLVKAMEKHRDQFYDWTGFVNPIFETIRNNVMDMYPVVVDIRDVLYDVRAMVSDVAGTARMNADTLREINVSIVAQGITTAEAARALGDQIASNLKGQMVPV